MNVFRYEFRQYRRGLLGWCVGMVAFVVVYMSFMPAFLDESEALRRFFSGVGQLLTKAMGFDVDVFFGPLGFYGYILTFLTLIGSIQAVSLGLSILSKESRMRTADFLLTKPIRRRNIFGQKLLTSALILLVTQGVFYAASTLGMFAAMDDIAFAPFMLISLSFGLIQFLFLAIGLLVAAISQRIKSVITVSTGIAIGFFVLGMVSNMTGDAKLRFLAPMRYFETAYILSHNAYETEYLILCVGLTLAMGIAALALYIRRDTRSV